MVRSVCNFDNKAICLLFVLVCLNDWVNHIVLCWDLSNADDLSLVLNCCFIICCY